MMDIKAVLEMVTFIFSIHRGSNNKANGCYNNIKLLMPYKLLIL